MIGYVTLGSNNLPRAFAFYDALFAAVDIKQLTKYQRGVAWGESFDKPSFAVMTPFDGKPATVGNGVMIGLYLSSADQVNAIHAKALALGGTDEGAPGPRGEHFCGAYFRDLDGNKLAAFYVS